MPKADDEALESMGGVKVTKSPLVFVVEDDESLRLALDGLLTSAGYAVRLFPSGEELLRSDHLSEGACIILDVNMPKMSGFDIQRKLKSKRIECPLLFLSARKDKDTRSRALRGGAYAFLTKPVDEEALLSALRAGLDSRGKAFP